ncbi:Thioredoxin-domain-containing protein [Mycena venus]|uniref:Thioredoxin-domain-containing protein n=1 Tax=Mycena venus TaxID=2733690 RepID=A0A8H7DAR7_9AGAR|nr:Thioredoxin-domain-containing protein [Mycena venus]
MMTTTRVFKRRTRLAFYNPTKSPAYKRNNKITTLPHTPISIPHTSEMSKPVEIQSVKQWNDIIESSTAAGKTIVVDFHALWCGPCKAIAPKYNQLASQNPQVQFLRVDVDEHPQIAETFHVSAMPTFFAIKSQNVVGMLRGANPQGLVKLVLDHAGPNPPIAPSSESEKTESTEAVQPAARL